MNEENYRLRSCRRSDVVIVGKNGEAADILTNMAIQRFHEISLSLNSNKSVSISIEHDHLDERSLSIIKIKFSILGHCS